MKYEYREMPGHPCMPGAYLCLAFCLWIIQTKPSWICIYRAGSQREYIRALLISSFKPQFPRPKFLPGNRDNKKIPAPMGSNCRHAALSQGKNNPAVQGGFIYSGSLRMHIEALRLHLLLRSLPILNMNPLERPDAVTLNWMSGLLRKICNRINVDRTGKKQRNLEVPEVE